MAKAPAPALREINIHEGKWFTGVQYKAALESGELLDHDQIYFRASGVSKLMSYADKPIIPDGAMTEIKKTANRIIYGTEPDLNTFAIDKGRECEELGIDLYNEVKFTFHVKNATRMYYWHPEAGIILSGECDLECLEAIGKKTIDIKMAYNTESMPLWLEEGDKKEYEWQLDCYNLLYHTHLSEIAYCMVSTPDHLIKKGEPLNWHLVDHIPPEHRLSTIERNRDDVRINQVLNRLILAKQKVLDLLKQRNFNINERQKAA